MTKKVTWDELLALATDVSVTLSSEFVDSLKTKSNFVLKTNTAVDLGENPNQSYLSFSRETSIFPNGVYLVGPDINELSGSQPLALQLNISGQRVNDELLYLIIQNLKRELQVKGVMVKGSGNKIWLRFSFNSIAEGLNLSVLGSVLLYRLREEYDELETAQVLLITVEGRAFDIVKDTSESWNKEQEALKAQVWDKRGYNFKDCHVIGHCGKCTDKKLCANIKKIDRILVHKHQEQENKNE